MYLSRTGIYSCISKSLSSWLWQLGAEVAGGLLLPVIEHQSSGTGGCDRFGCEFYFFSPASLGSGPGGYTPAAAPAPVAAPTPCPPATEDPSATAPTLPIAMIFPGQGSQSVGMLKDVKGLPAVAAMFEQAKAILGYDLLEVITNGPESKLTETQYCQPAMFVAGLAAIEKLKLEDPDVVAACRATAGLSLGEYTALTFAGALAFEDGLRLVKLRAEAMQEAVRVCFW